MDSRALFISTSEPPHRRITRFVAGRTARVRTRLVVSAADRRVLSVLSAGGDPIALGFEMANPCSVPGPPGLNRRAGVARQSHDTGEAGDATHQTHQRK